MKVREERPRSLPAATHNKRKQERDRPGKQYRPSDRRDRKMFAKHEPVVHFEVQVSITFERPITEMTKLELLEAARELRVLRYTRSRNVQSPVYRHIVGLEEQIAWRYAGVAGRPDGWQPGQPLPTDLLFAS